MHPRCSLIEPVGRFVFAVVIVVFAGFASTARSQSPQTRSFVLEYGLTIDAIALGDRVQLWMPLPREEDRYQVVDVLSSELPGDGMQTQEKKYGNQMIYRAWQASDERPVQAKMVYRVLRTEANVLVTTDAADSTVRESTVPPLNDQQRKLFLSANAKVPVEGLPIQWSWQSNDVIRSARSIYERVDDHVQYDKSKPGYGNGDVLWVCDSRFGNCTDFHSLFISMARASKIPARFEIGFPLPTDNATGTIGGYHCWASFYADDYGWVPVDISEADKHPELKQYYFGNLSENRVTFTIGRDIDLVPKQAAPPLNYFIYPHVEINGKPATTEQLKFQFTYKDLDSHEPH
ncbi:MAG: transglutaminase domain-containing protein [Pirellulaceae bacterium]|nr:transglutaminase domain-containing protein [Pirellulaceae bacterium]